ncbi:unnamed protein product, partial [Effrenium voratum]
EEAAAKPGGHNILVAVRCRALLPQERAAGGHAIITICNGTTVILEDPHTTAADDYLRLNKSKERRYHFDQALEETAQNIEVYERTTRFLIPSVIQGFNATVFAYGATSAGKTHTMLGYPGEPGIMLLTLRDLFSEVGNQKSNLHFEIKCSFLEVYNENAPRCSKFINTAQVSLLFFGNHCVDVFNGSPRFKNMNRGGPF